MIKIPGLEVIKLSSCSSQLSMKVQLLIKTKMLKIQTFHALKLSDAAFIMLLMFKCQLLFAF